MEVLTLSEARDLPGAKRFVLQPGVRKVDVHVIMLGMTSADRIELARHMRRHGVAPVGEPAI